MTLLATEIHNHNDPKNAVIVFAADRRISNAQTGVYLDTRKKIFEVPWLNSGIGYFGLAEIPSATRSQPMQERQTIPRANLPVAAQPIACGLLPVNSHPPVHGPVTVSGFCLTGHDMLELTAALKP